MNSFWNGTLALGVVLQLLVISVLIRGAYRRFPVLSLYAVVSFLLTVLEASAYLKLSGWKADDLKQMYWINEIVVQVLVFALVISLTSSALQAASGRRRVGLSLYGAGLMVMMLAIAMSYNPKQPLYVWMTDTSRNLSFASAILNLLLWSVLLSQRERDPQLLMLSGGFGVQTTGKAMGQAIRSLQFWNAGNVLMVITYILSLAIIFHALRLKAPGAVGTTATVAPPGPGDIPL